MQVGHDDNENEESASDSRVTNVERTERTSEGKDIGVKSFEMTTEVSLTMISGGKEESQGEYLYFQTFFLGSPFVWVAFGSYLIFDTNFTNEKIFISKRLFKIRPTTMPVVK